MNALILISYISQEGFLRTNLLGIVVHPSIRGNVWRFSCPTCMLVIFCGWTWFISIKHNVNPVAQTLLQSGRIKEVHHVSPLQDSTVPYELNSHHQQHTERRMVYELPPNQLWSHNISLVWQVCASHRPWIMTRGMFIWEAFTQVVLPFSYKYKAMEQHVGVDAYFFLVYWASTDHLRQRAKNTKQQTESFGVKRTTTL